MDYVHHCHFCGNSRPARSAAMVATSCDACGCGLTSLRRDELPEPELSDVERLDRVLPPADAPVMRAARLLLAAIVALAAARIGHAQGGAPIAVVASGLAILLVLPVILPDR